MKLPSNNGLAGSDALALIGELISGPSPQPTVNEIGKVSEVSAGIVMVSGLGRALSDELVVFASGVKGIVFDLEPTRLGVILLGPSDNVAVGDDVRRTGKVVSVPVGEKLLGRVVDAMGKPLDDLGPITGVQLRPVEADAPAILSRVEITRPLSTGLKAIDAAVPIGRGQRELIIGDRQTGKTSIAVDAILNQATTGVICIYCAIGQRGDAVARVIGALKDSAMMENTIVMVTSGEETPGLSYIAPYAATTMAEYFSDQGRDVLVIYDDLTRHAQSYRELSLLLRRPPGREAYPGDIFYVHARLLERAGQFSASHGGGSLTALPVIETQAGNLSAYIPTNLISITDGQVYLSPHLVRKNQFPAVDLGKSVSRVGGKAQSPAFREVAGNIRVTLSQFEELESFARFGTRLDEETKKRLMRGSAVRGALRQPERDPIPAPEQLTILLAAMNGLLDGIAENEMAAAMTALRETARIRLGLVADRIMALEKLEKEDKQTILDFARDALAEFEKGEGDGTDP
ncbi:F0F1 ATP synthase subunit alpha [Sneathiella sp. HT1-7]|uniref:F0F1 ATP synthase subunit alpha n=1 Tax=Sneathiella sp. HT1-7 TaxID=2887192 RepID=UPI001D150176|nr:F0F1 ATP synthase subunit alpha [Sneathiella sp. HT1-7]MCC3305121.1 F0F1 ATP synthase subunit alpha [Sneathiella sp. HT1-7]